MQNFRTSWRRGAVQLGLLHGLVIALTPCLQPAHAQLAEDPLTSKFAINDLDPVSSVPTPAEAMKQPLEMGYHIMLLTERADAATKRGDHAKAAEYWRALAKAAPDRSLSYSRMCQEYEAAGKFQEAFDNCRTALGKGGVTVDDNLRFVQLAIEKKPGQLDARDIADVDAIADHLEGQLGADSGPLIAHRIRCQLGTRLGDLARLHACTEKLQALAPNDPQTLVYAWSLAIRTGNLTNADKALQRAQQAKLPAPAIQRMVDTLEAEHARRAPWWQRGLRDATMLAAVAGVILAALIAAFVSRRRQRLPSA